MLNSDNKNCYKSRPYWYGNNVRGGSKVKPISQLDEGAMQARTLTLLTPRIRVKLSNMVKYG